MQFRLATEADLPLVKNVFDRLRARMDKENICIWNEDYPYLAFVDDVEKRRLYLLVDDDSGELLAAATICTEARANADRAFTWEDPSAPAAYIYRLGVSVDHARSGIGSRLMEHMKSVAREMGSRYLRVFVVDMNLPAHPFYQRNSFLRVDGVYEDPVIPGTVLKEYGYEFKL